MTYLYFCHVFFPHIKQAFRKYRFYKSHNLQLQNLFKDFAFMVNCEAYKICLFFLLIIVSIQGLLTRIYLVGRVLNPIRCGGGFARTPPWRYQPPLCRECTNQSQISWLFPIRSLLLSGNVIFHFLCNFYKKLTVKKRTFFSRKWSKTYFSHKYWNFLFQLKNSLVICIFFEVHYI